MLKSGLLRHATSRDTEFHSGVCMCVWGPDQLYDLFKPNNVFYMCALQKKPYWGPRAVGPLGAQISQKRSSFFLNICGASASKRIIANQLEHKVD